MKRYPFDFPNYWRPCNRGIPIKSRQILTNKYDDQCLCPPSYYGAQCEYQSQRVSLTLQILTDMEWRTLFIIGITLIDNDYTVHSFEQFNYVSIRDCRAKFTTYLLFKSRPKNRTSQYFVRIDIFLRNASEYRASWLYPIQFTFLPVHRMAIQLNIPLLVPTKDDRSSFCGEHGTSTQYVNNNQKFCYCDSGWRGSRCDIRYECYCSSDSVCMGSSTSCLCPLYKFGTRCHLEHVACRSISSKLSSPCFNDGVCVPADKRFVNVDKPFICACSEGFSGDLCQFNNSRVEITFSEEFDSFPTSIFAHFITVHRNTSHTHVSMLSKIAFDQMVVVFQFPLEFHIIFVEFDRLYYLIYLQSNYRSSQIIKTQINSAGQCLHIDKLFNSTILNYHPLRRAKFYHQPCRDRIKLQCFYDSSTFMCLCDSERKANCFNYDFNIKRNCSGKNYCMNDGDCFLDTPTCPTSSVCQCKDCFYGVRCQFSTRSFNPSLDVILGYHIRPSVSLSRQTNAVKTSFGLILLLCTTGFVSTIFSLITFQAKASQEFGCGLYLLATSITSLITIFILLLRFCLLFFNQYEILAKPWLKTSHCVLMDFLLRILLNIGDWFNAFVAIERAYMVILGTKVRKEKTKQVIFLCVIYLKDARIRSKARGGSFSKYLGEQFNQHYHLVISACVLVLLALPRLIIYLYGGCMKSAREPWLALSGYFISFVPPVRNIKSTPILNRIRPRTAGADAKEFATNSHKSSVNSSLSEKKRKEK
ncbi:unnamed protein product [Adineta steineri]|uniref:EGF-like domain-containing protein n=1 Tax=Adineta steineri TaxID=433720 RepID=A0A815Q3X3_9BILA|nr:unnamed protein product [Adineta steineri]